MTFKIKLLLSALTMFSILANGQTLENVNLYGKINNSESKMIYLSVLANGGMLKVDSCQIRDDSTFSLATSVNIPNFYQININDEQSAIMVLEPGDNVMLELNGKAMMTPLKISGSRYSEELYSILKAVNSYTQQLQSLEALYQQYYGTPQQDSISQILVPQYEYIDGQRKAHVRNVLMNKPSLGNVLFIDQVNIDEDFELYQRVDEALYSQHPYNPYVADIHRKVQDKQKLAPGKMAPEISLQSPEGEVIKLSSLRGKVVMIDFWASWCKPCRAENPNMVRIYNKFKDKGFDVYGVSLDQTKSDWVRAISSDGLVWHHVSDLRYWNSVAAKEYGVGSIPFTVLVDKDGKILATGLRGESLERKLHEIFGN